MLSPRARRRGQPRGRGNHRTGRRATTWRSAGRCRTSTGRTSPGARRARCSRGRRAQGGALRRRTPPCWSGAGSGADPAPVDHVMGVDPAELPEEQRPCLWCLSKLPFGGFPEELWYDIRQASVLAVAEEHVAHGSAGSLVTGQLIEHRCMPPQYRHFTACGYPSERYGSQRFHRVECGLTPDLVLRSLTCP